LMRCARSTCRVTFQPHVLLYNVYTLCSSSHSVPLKQPKVSRPSSPSNLLRRIWRYLSFLHCMRSRLHLTMPYDTWRDSGH
jgi:hypothetical protein